eukprot:gene25151-10979_t
MDWEDVEGLFGCAPKFTEENDGIRITSEDECFLIEPLPPATAAIYGVGSTAGAARLKKAYEAFS